MLGRSKMLTRLTLAAVSAALVASACDSSLTVSAQLQRVTKAPASGEALRLVELIDFPWDFFVVLGPYTTRNAAESTLGFAWPEFDRFNLESSDSFSLLVFIAKGNVIRAEQHPRCTPDFASELLGHVLSPEQAVFTLDREVACPLARAAV
jgi:hypothetical protein